MAQDYLNIIGNWNSMAQQGRERANAAMETKLKTFELQAKNQMLQKQNEEVRKAQGNERIGDDKQIHRPNINPSNTYNF